MNKLINMLASKEEELIYIYKYIYIVKRARQCEYYINVLEELKEFRLLIQRARSDSKRKLES